MVRSRYGNAWHGPGDCHHALLVEVATSGRLSLIGHWQPQRDSNPCLHLRGWLDYA